MITAHTLLKCKSLLTRIRILGFRAKEVGKKDFGDLDMKNFKEAGKSYKNAFGQRSYKITRPTWEHQHMTHSLSYLEVTLILTY